MSIRTERVASLIKEEIGLIVLREYSDPSLGFITVTDVQMTADLKIARVAFSIFGKPELQSKTMKMLEDQKAHIRSSVASKLTLRFMPALQFYLDDTLERVDRINTLLKKIHDEEDGGAHGS